MEQKSICAMTEGRSGQFTTFDGKSGNKTVFVVPGASQTIFDCRDTGIITRFWMTMPGWFWRYWDEKAAVDPSVLRLTILKLYFDGSNVPSVAVPVGDFFGVGHCEYRHYTSAYLGMSSGGFYCYFPMPFQKGFRMEVENLHGSETVELFFNLNWQKLSELPEGTGRFHCAFSCGENSGGEPLEIADIQGRGHFAGCSLSIQGSRPNYLSCLEAPEYIWIDGESEPSIVGTGLEDYFNGGWYFRNGEFSAQTHGLPLKDALRSMVSMYRFHDADRIAFRTSLKMAFVNPWEKDRLQPFRYSSTAYYYLDRAAPACYPLPSAQRLIGSVYRVRDMDFQAIP